MTGWIAALPMYDLEEVRPATNAWWAGLARHLTAAGIEDVPQHLSRRTRVADVWDDPALLLGQGCGYPLTHAYRSAWRYVATPVYAAPGCAGVDYRSWLVVPTGSTATTPADVIGGVAAVNDAQSHSGALALKAALAPHRTAQARRHADPLFRAVIWTGGHRASLAAVADGQADVAAVDCVTHALLAEHAPAALDGTRVLGPTLSAPGLPLIAGARVDDATLARLRAGVRLAIAAPDLAPARSALLLSDVAVLPDGAYERIRTLADETANIALTA